MASTSSTVVIVGGGIIGPVLALLLKQKGWSPVIVEKVRDVGASGLAIAIHPNGLKVLNQAGVAKELLEGTLPWEVWSEYTSDGDFLGGPGSTLVSEWTDKYGWPAIGVSRTRIQLLLREIAKRKGIEYRQGWRLKDIQQRDDGITAISEDGDTIEAVFLVGCDGLKSATRELLLAQQGVESKEPDFTGIAVIGGNCPTPPFQKRDQGVNNWYGATNCVISHPLENGVTIWGLNYVPETVVPESWRTIPQDQLQTEIAKYLDQFKDWSEPVTSMIAGSTKIQTLGLYDRPELPVSQWYHKRIMLLGDAAHPTTPHIGQGANQGLEDCWTFIQQIPVFNESKQRITTDEFAAIFHAVATERQPRTSRVVTAARAAGENRVIRGGEKDVKGRQERDARIRAAWADTNALQAMYDNFYTGPFEDVGAYHKVTA